MGSWEEEVRRKVRDAGVSIRRWRVRAGFIRRDIFLVGLVVGGVCVLCVCGCVGG